MWIRDALWCWSCLPTLFEVVSLPGSRASCSPAPTLLVEVGSPCAALVGPGTHQDSAGVEKDESPYLAALASWNRLFLLPISCRCSGVTDAFDVLPELYVGSGCELSLQLVCQSRLPTEPISPAQE